jgi:hypothetical protein
MEVLALRHLGPHILLHLDLLVPGPVLVVRIFLHEDVFITWPQLADVLV